MATTTAGPEIERLIQLLARLPGLGPRSARRVALFLIKKREQIMAPLGAAIQSALEKIEICKICGNIDSRNPCAICTDPRRDPTIIIVGPAAPATPAPPPPPPPNSPYPP